MTAALIPILPASRPLAAVARPARGRRPTYRRTVVLAGGDYLRDAPLRAAAHLEQLTGPTRCSRVRTIAYPPWQATGVLADLPEEGIDPVELAGARLAADAVADAPHLWVFIATCQVLWQQTEPLRRCS